MPSRHETFKMSTDCLSDDALVHLKSYKYSSVDKSFTSRYILKHYWNAFVQLLPLWLAPNMVTLLGFLFIIANVGLVLVYVPDLVGPAPSWVYYSFAFGLWMYSTMDNVDGKQARRTGTSSGLGELFDHGIDSLNCTLASLLETAAMGYGATRIGAFTALIPCLPMFFSTWETYHTHTLYLGYFNGPTEGLMIAASVMILSGMYGPQMWQHPLDQYLPYLPDQLGNLIESFDLKPLTFQTLWLPIVLSGFFLFHLPSCIINVYKARRRQNLSFLPTLIEWTPIVLFTGSCIIWIGSPYSSILSHNRLPLLCAILSFVFGRMTTKIILAHLTRQPFPMFTVLLLPLVGAAFVVGIVPDLLPRSSPYHGLSLVTPGQELAFMWIYLAFALYAYGRWAVLVIGSICKYLGINALTIPRGKLEEATRRREMERAEKKKMTTEKKNQPREIGARMSMTDGNVSAGLEGQKLGADDSVLMVQKELNGRVGDRGGTSGSGSNKDNGQLGERQKENKKMK